MRELKILGAFTRGTESFGHFLAMLRISVARTVIGCTAVAVVLAGTSMAIEMDDEAKLLPTYVAASVQARIMPDAPRRLGKWQGTNADAMARLREAFDGRSVSFLVKQLVLRTAVVAAILLPALVVLLTLLGRLLSADRHLRGARIVDTTTWLYRHRYRISEAACALVGAAIIDTGLIAIVSMPHGVVAIMNLVKSWCAVNSSSFAAIISDDAGLIWHTGAGIRAMLRPEESYAALTEAFGCGPLTLAAIGSVGACIGGATMILVMRKTDIKPVPESKQELLHLAGIPIRRKRETQHFAVVGDTGSGKSVAMTPMLHTIRQRGQRAVVWQYNMEYIREFYRPGYDVILNPLDLRGAAWTPWAEIRTQADYLSLGKSLFPASVHHDKFWSIAGSSLFGSITERMLGRSRPFNKELAYELTHASLEEMQDSVRDTMGQRYLDEHAAEMSTSLLATLTSQLESFRFLRDLRDGEQAFSIKDFVTQESDRWLFVSMSAEQEAIRPLVSLWLDTALRAALSLPDNDQAAHPAHQRRLFVVLDELPALQVLPSLVQSLAAGRSKGLCAILGLQSFEQLQGTYGTHKAKAMLGQAQTKLFTRTTEGETAEWIKKQLGSSEVEQSNESQQMGANTQRDGVSVQRSVAQRDLVLTSEIQTLPDLTGYLRTVDRPLLKVSYTWRPGRPDPQEEFVAAPEPEPPRPPPWAQARKHLARAQQLDERGDVINARDAARMALSCEPDEVVTHAAESIIAKLSKEGFKPLLERAEDASKRGYLSEAISHAEGALRLCDDKDAERLETAWQLVKHLREMKPRWDRAQCCLEDSRAYCASGDLVAALGATRQARSALGDNLCLVGLDAWEQELKGRLRRKKTLVSPAEGGIETYVATKEEQETDKHESSAIDDADADAAIAAKENEESHKSENSPSNDADADAGDEELLTYLRTRRNGVHNQ